MRKIICVKTWFACMLLLTSLAVSSFVNAEPTVEISLIDPDIRKQTIDLSSIEEVKLAVRVVPGVKVRWEIVEGGGEFDGGNEGISSIYLPPANLSGDQRITIRAVATDDSGTNAVEVSFTLRAPLPNTPTPTMTPTNTPTATPTSMPTAMPSDTPEPTPTKTPKLKPTRTPKPTPTQRPINKPTATPIPAPLQTPDISIELDCQPTESDMNTLLQQSLPENLAKYKDLKEKNGSGETIDVNEFLLVIKAVVCDMKAIEDILQEGNQNSPDAAISKRIDNLHATRLGYEREFDQIKNGK